MALHRRGRGRRDANEAEIVAALREAGCTVVHLDDPADLLVGRDGVTYLLEVKSPKGKLRESQKQFSEAWDGHYAVVRSVEEAIEEVVGTFKTCERCGVTTGWRNKNEYVFCAGCGATLQDGKWPGLDGLL